MVEQLLFSGIDKPGSPHARDPEDPCAGCGADLAVVGLAVWNDVGRFCPDCEDNGTAYGMPRNRPIEPVPGLHAARPGPEKRSDVSLASASFVTGSSTCSCGCGRALPPPARTGRASRFATAACRKRAQRRRSRS